MPRVFKPVDIAKEEKEIRKDYFDRHTPQIFCDKKAKREHKFKVKIKIGREYQHPDDFDHYISYVQLWNRETFIAEAHFTPGSLGNKPNNMEIDFFIVPLASMNLTAMAVCTKHGLWQSEEKYVELLD